MTKSIHLVKIPDPSLRKKCRSIANDDIPSLADFYEILLAKMHEYNGVGLAAPQLGLNVRVCAIRAFNDGKDEILINPLIVNFSIDTEKMDEGCLSIPRSVFKVNRHPRVEVEYQNTEGESVTKEVSGLLAQCVQHELDHLKGTLVSDRVKYG